MKTLSIQQQIQAEYKKIPARLTDNGIVIGALHSLEELGAEGVLDQLKDIDKYSRKRTPLKSVVFPELKTGLVPFVCAGVKKNSNTKRESGKRKAK